MTASGPVPACCMCRATNSPAFSARIHRALKPSGVFYASFKIGEGDGRDNLGRYYNYPSPEWLRGHLRRRGGVEIRSRSDTSEIKSFDETPADDAASRRCAKSRE